MNGFLPANIGTFVTLLMFVAIIPSCTVGGAIAAYLVQKIFFTIAGTFVYLYMFLSVPELVRRQLRQPQRRTPWLTLIIVIGAVVLARDLLGRIFWRQVKKLWEQAKEGGAILSTPKRYLTHAFLPSFLSWLCKLGVIAIFLAAFAIPVTFESIMWVVGSGSLANVASFTPGAVGVTQATNALALKTCCDVAEQRRDRLLDRAAADHDRVEPGASRSSSCSGSSAGRAASSSSAPRTRTRRRRWPRRRRSARRRRRRRRRRRGRLERQARKRPPERPLRRRRAS